MQQAESLISARDGRASLILRQPAQKGPLDLPGKSTLEAMLFSRGIKKWLFLRHEFSSAKWNCFEIDAMGLG